MCRVITYNIHSGVGRDNRQDYKRIGQFLAASGADIVLLQEMDTRPKHRDTAKDINDICADNVFRLVPSPAIREAHGWYGNAILTRFDIRTQETLDVSQANRQPRNVQIVELQTEKGPFCVVNTHKGLKKYERHAQVSMIHEYLSNRLSKTKMPLLLAGDFNEWQFFSRAFSALNRLLVQHKVGPTFPSQFPVFSLDRMWTTSDINLNKCKKIKNVQKKKYSDHLPIMADLFLPE